MEENKASPEVRKYLEYFQGVAPMPQPSEEELRQHHITVLPDFPAWSRVRLVSMGYEGSIATYQVTLGLYCVMLRVLHVSRSAGQINDKKIGAGVFGAIFEKALVSDKFVAKRTKFNGSANKQEIEMVIHEAAMYILCSAYKIGPKFQTNLPFAVICYDNAAEFHLEKCEPFITHFENEKDIQRLNEQFRSRVFWLHQLHIIHKDIKYENLLWSHYQNAYVLTDFGISQSIKQVAGQQTLTYFEGTFKTMSPTMQSLMKAKDSKGMVDLYYNDYWGVRVTMEQAQKIYNSPRVEKSKDPTIISEGFLEVDKNNELAQSMISNLEEQCSDKAPIISQSASKNSQKQLQQNFAPQLNSYEYYEMYDRATSLERHEFRLECWEVLPQSQKIEILELISRTNSVKKLTNFRRILESLHRHPMPPAMNQLAQTISKRTHNLQVHIESKDKVTLRMIRNYIRIFGVEDNKLEDYLRMKINNISFDQVSCRRYFACEVFMKETNKYLPSEDQWIKKLQEQIFKKLNLQSSNGQKIGQKLFIQTLKNRSKNAFAQILNNNLVNFRTKQFVLDNPLRLLQQEGFKFVNQQDLGIKFSNQKLISLVFYQSELTTEEFMKLLEQFSAESFEVGYLFCILTKKMIDEKRYDIALDHLKKSIEILGKENCSNPLIFSESIKIHLDQLRLQCNKPVLQEVLKSMRQIVDYFDGITSPYIDFFDRIAQIAEDQNQPINIDFIKQTQIQKLKPVKRFFQVLRMVRALYHNRLIEKHIQIIQMWKKAYHQGQQKQQQQLHLHLLYVEANYHISTNHSDKLLKCLKEAQAIIKTSDISNLLKSQYWSCLGHYFYMKGLYRDQINAFNNSITILQQGNIEQYYSFAKCYRQLATAHGSLLQYQKAREYGQKALTIIKNKQGKFSVFTEDCYNTLAQIYFKMNNIKKTLYYCNLKERAKQARLSLCWQIRANVSEQKQDFAKVIEHTWLSLQNAGLFNDYAYKSFNKIYKYRSKDLARHLINFVAGEGSNPPYRYRFQIQPQLFYRQDPQDSDRLPFIISTEQFINGIEVFVSKNLKNMIMKSNKFNQYALLQLLKDNAQLIKVFTHNAGINEKCYLIAIRLSIETLLYWIYRSEWELAQSSLNQVKRCLKKANRCSYTIPQKKMLEQYAQKLRVRANCNFIEGMKKQMQK